MRRLARLLCSRRSETAASPRLLPATASAAPSALADELRRLYPFSDACGAELLAWCRAETSLAALGANGRDPWGSCASTTMMLVHAWCSTAPTERRDFADRVLCVALAASVALGERRGAPRTPDAVRLATALRDLRRQSSAKAFGRVPLGRSVHDCLRKLEFEVQALRR